MPAQTAARSGYGGPAGARHGAVCRSQAHTDWTSGTRGGFGKLLPCLTAAVLDERTLDGLVEGLHDLSTDAPTAILGNAVPGRDAKGNIATVVELGFAAIPAGFTYFGQFVDHDITFDPTPVLAPLADPLVDVRTPRLDLDSLYGTGPDDQPFLYDQEYDVPGAKLLVDHIAACPPAPAFDDLPRNSQGRALVGDPRNDEHAIISQLHLLFIGFHNAVVTYLHECVRVPDADLFERAREIVRWHYQWIVTHEFLQLVVGPETASSVLVPGGRGEAPSVRLEHYRPEGRPFIPLEFSAAAYRFGHSMVRNDYTIRAGDTPVPIIEASPGEHRTLAGERRLTADLLIEWDQFFVLAVDGGDSDPQLAREINPTIGLPLFTLPHGRSLPRLNLERGRKVGLPSGQDVACAMGHDPLAAEHLYLERFAPELRPAIQAATPLWLYLLCEAAAPPGSGSRLGPVGGRIVAEVLIGLLAADPDSYFGRSPTWKPHLGAVPGDFRMRDLIQIAKGTIEPGSAEDHPGG